MTGLVVGGVALAHPVLNASGTLDAAAAHAILGDATLGAAAHVTKTITLEPRDGNPPPRIAEAASGMLNSIGLPGPGLERFRADVLPRLTRLCDVPIVVSVGGFRPDDYARAVAALDADAAVAAIELNLSCPNVQSGCASIGADAAETEAVTARCTAATTRPVWVKLSASVADVAPLARAAAAGGAAALTLTNTARGTAIDRVRGGPYFGGGGGGLSGPALRPLALQAVFTARAAVAIDIVGLGGVEDADDAVDLLAAGAQAVAVGTATFRDPDAIRRVRDGLEAALARRPQTSLAAPVG
jgi:dihydroorotate dehydrogenase (NAD+) catalytic subunit